MSEAIKQVIDNENCLKESKTECDSNASPGNIAKKFFVKTIYGRDLFDDIIAYAGRDGWNRFFERLILQGFWAGSISRPELGDGEYEFQPICVEFDLKDQDFKNADLSGLNFIYVDLDRSDFTGANLAGSKIGSATGAVFRGADLRNTTFTGGISGADFEGANFDGTVFDNVTCGKFNRPRALPEQYLAQCLLTPTHYYHISNAEKKRIREQPMLKVRAEFYPHF